MLRPSIFMDHKLRRGRTTTNAFPILVKRPERIVFNAPRRSGLEIRSSDLRRLLGLGRRCEIDRYIERLSALTLGRQVRYNLAHFIRRERLLGHLIIGHEVDAVPARRPPKRLAPRPTARDPNRDARGLDRFWQ